MSHKHAVFLFYVPSVCVHVKDLQSLYHQSVCKITLSLCNLLFIAGQIVYNGLITVWATGNHLTWEGTHTQTLSYRHTGKWKFMLALSWKMFVTVSWLGAIWLDMTWKGKKKNVGDQGIRGWKKHMPKKMLQFGRPNVCSVCKCQIQNTFPHLMNNSTESNWSGQCNTAKNRQFSMEH